MKDYVDFHTHTLMSGHAYNTMNEMIAAAREKGIAMYGITEHGPAMPGSCHRMHFGNLQIIDRKAYGIELFMGVELNILDEKGTVDLERNLLKEMDVVIASLHVPCIENLGKEANTEAVINCIKNPCIDIIGHPDDGYYPLDLKAVVQAAAEYGTLLEVNNHSLGPHSPRANARENELEMLKWCKEYRAEIIIGSDAHIDCLVGSHEYAHALLEEVEFPKELIVNTDQERTRAHTKQYRNY